MSEETTNEQQQPEKLRNAAIEKLQLGQGGSWGEVWEVVNKNKIPVTTPTLEFTFKITTQQGNRFSGQSSDGKRTETIIGAISPSNQSGIVLDDDGQYLFTVRDSNTLDACYSHSKANSKLVSCYEWKRIP